MGVPSSQSAENYVWALELPAARPSFEAARPVQFTTAPEAAVVGTKLVEFTDKVPVAVRDAISDGILLAQLAANKAATGSEDVFRWYDKYVEVLQNLGCELRDVNFQHQAVSDTHAGMHKAVVPVIAAMLGPQAAAASVVLAALDGLSEMDRSTPWITVFDRASQHARGAKFQVSYVDANLQGEPEVIPACFGINAMQTITQVLFFKFKAQGAELKKADGKMVVSMQRLASAKDAIAGRVGPFVTDYVAKLET